MALEANIFEERDRQKRISELEAGVLTRKEGILLRRFLEPRRFVQYVEGIADIVGEEMRCVQDISTTYSFSHEGRTQSEIAGRFKAYDYVDGGKMDQRYSAMAMIAAKGVQVMVQTLPYPPRQDLLGNGIENALEILEMTTTVMSAGMALYALMNRNYGHAAAWVGVALVTGFNLYRRIKNAATTHGISVTFKTTEPVTDARGYNHLKQAHTRVQDYLWQPNTQNLTSNF